MTTPEMNFLRMAEAVIAVLKLFTAKFGLAPKLQVLYDLLTEMVDTVHAKNQQLVLENDFATVKEEKRDELEKGAEELVNKIQLYANMENDSLTKGKTNLYFTDLHSVSGDKLVDTCISIHTLATLLVAKLADYKVLPATLADFMKQITAFSELLSAPRMDISARAATNKEITKIISEIRALLNDKMDKSMNTIKNTETEFFAAYTGARVIVDRLGKRRQTKPADETTGMISGTITDTETGEPLTDVIVLMEGLAEATTTDEDGTFMFDGVSAGLHNITCTLELYKSLTLTGIVVKAGEETETEGNMDKG